ncbi:MAG: IS1380 family transposase, partial [Actinomycetes bacterium]
MPTECSPDRMEFAPVAGRSVVAAFDGGAITSDAGALLLGATDRAIGLVRRFAACFVDHRAPDQVEHSVATLGGQRVLALALGYEDLVDHDQLRHDPVLAAVTGKLAARRSDCAPLAGKSTLNRLEHAPAGAPTRYHKIGHDGALIERLLVELFLDAHRAPPAEIVLDLDATDDPLHGQQEGRFFHGYYGCYCYLPLYVFCGDHLLAAKLRRSNIDASAGAVEEVAWLVGQIRASWPEVRIILRADSGFAREALMSWCEAHRVDYVLGLARNPRLVRAIAVELAQARAAAAETGKPARCFKDFRYQTLDTWSRERRVVGKAEHLVAGDGGTSADPRFVVTSLAAEAWAAQPLYEELH